MRRMTPEQWHKVKEVFEAALGHAPGERSAFLGQACAGDDVLRSEVKSLLSSYEQESSFMETPAAALAAQSLVTEESAALVGQQLGHYQIVREIGRGGMGVVYLAQDTKLGRPVALKLLPTHLTSDPDRLRRFEREARSASALNHPNILTIHEIGQLDGLHFIETEFIDGMTLRERIKSKELKLSEALKIVEQMASALAAAHEAGIVHRDIKPENVMLRRDGYVKVLDFGLAKLTEQREVQVTATSAVTAGTNTNTGIMGTLGYMSPEQARGESVDQRTDVFSLGVVIYEMVTGRLPFEARTDKDGIVCMPPQLAHYLPKVPAQLRVLVNKALRTNQEERYQTITELLTDLRSVSSKRSAKNRFTARRLGSLAGTLAVVVGGLLWFYASSRTVKSSLPPMKVLPLTGSSGGSEYGPAFSPDGNMIAFTWNGPKGDNDDIYIKLIGSEPPRRLTVDPASDFHPVWSPDGRFIAFDRFKSVEEEATFLISRFGGPEQKLYSPRVHSGWGGDKNLDWSPDGKFLAGPWKFSAGMGYQLRLFSVETLEERAITFPPPEFFGDLIPTFSPDGRTIAFVRVKEAFISDLYVVPFAGGEARRLTFDNLTIEGLDWTPDGSEIVFSSRRGGRQSLWRIPANGGDAERVAVGENATSISIARKGHRLAYTEKVVDPNIWRLEIPSASSNVTSQASLISTRFSEYDAQYSPDGKRITFWSDRSGSPEIWVCDSQGLNPVQLTSFGGPSVGWPHWSPDGQQVVFNARIVDGNSDVFVISADGGRPRRLTTDISEDALPSWSSDGLWIYFASKRTGDWQVWKVSADGEQAVQLTKQGGYAAVESPDGKELYYERFAESGIWMVPTTGGEETLLSDLISPNWSTWAVRPEGIYFVGDGKDSGLVLRVYDFTTRKVSQVARLGKGAQILVAGAGLSISPDGRWVLYSRIDHSSSNIMLVENFR